MCLSIPAKIISIKGDTAKASIGGTVIVIGLQLVEDISINDYVLIHTGFALQKISEKEALATIELIKEFQEFNDLEDKKENNQA